ADSPYREVQVLLDGNVVGIAAPYPHIYTGGWSNPFLWYVLPAPRAFDVKPLTYDLSPWLGQLTDGAAHRVAIPVLGVPARQPGDDSVHTWGDGENPDALKATWTDESWSVSGLRVAHENDRYAIDGSITVSPDNRLTTTITVTDTGNGYEDTYRGEAAFTLN